MLLQRTFFYRFQIPKQLRREVNCEVFNPMWNDRLLALIFFHTSVAQSLNDSLGLQRTDKPARFNTTSGVGHSTLSLSDYHIKR